MIISAAQRAAVRAIGLFLKAACLLFDIVISLTSQFEPMSNVPSTQPRIERNKHRGPGPRGGRPMLPFSLVAAVVLVFSVLAGCNASEEDEKAGGVLVLVAAGVPVPAVIDRVEIAVLGPDGASRGERQAVLPLAAEANPSAAASVWVSAENARGAQLLVRGMLGDRPRVVKRVALSALPENAQSEVRVTLDWLCLDVNGCGGGTCERGQCRSLPLAEPHVGPTEAPCFSPRACFQNGVRVPVPQSGCAVPAALLSRQPDTWLGVRLPARAQGCAASSDDCLLPISRMGPDAFPPALCDAVRKTGAELVLATRLVQTQGSWPICAWARYRFRLPADRCQSRLPVRGRFWNPPLAKVAMVVAAVSQWLGLAGRPATPPATGRWRALVARQASMLFVFPAAWR